MRALAPCLNSAKFEGRWGLRHVMGEEVLKAKDVLDFYLGLMSNADNAFLGALLPGKCLMAGVTALYNGGGGGEELPNRKRKHTSSAFGGLTRVTGVMTGEGLGVVINQSRRGGVFEGSWERHVCLVTPPCGRRSGGGTTREGPS